jgi:cell division protein FtsB
MKTIYRFLGFLLFIFIALAVLLNISNSIAIETAFFSIKVNVGFLILLCSLFGSIATLFFLFSFNSSSKNKQLKKQLESHKINYEVESDKVKQLESKIKTLEEALRIATNK